MKRLLNRVILLAGPMLIVVVFLFSGLVGCTFRSAGAMKAIPVHGPWSLNLEGFRIENIDEVTFKEGATPGCHGVKWSDDKGHVWEGIPLWLLVGRVDNPNIEHGTGAFDDALANKGYEVQIIGSDSHTVKLTSSEVKRNDNMIVAYRIDGHPLPDTQWPLELVGSAVNVQNQISMIATIKLDLLASNSTSSPPATTAGPIVLTTPPSEAGDQVNIADYRLTINGLVNNPLILTYEAVLGYPAVDETAQLWCEDFFLSNNEWTGVPVKTLLTEANIQPKASQVTFYASDGYKQVLPLEYTQGEGPILAYKMNGQVLTRQDGYPLVLVLKGWAGKYWVKYLVRIEVS